MHRPTPAVVLFGCPSEVLERRSTAADGGERRRNDRDPTTRSHLGSEIGAAIGDDRDACHARKPETKQNLRRCPRFRGYGRISGRASAVQARSPRAPTSGFRLAL